ncbi:MAG: hypothetical protein AAFR76_14950 [Planctomycetota bacterium]
MYYAGSSADDRAVRRLSLAALNVVVTLVVLAMTICVSWIYLWDVDRFGFWLSAGIASAVMLPLTVIIGVWLWRHDRVLSMSIDWLHRSVVVECRIAPWERYSKSDRVRLVRLPASTHNTISSEYRFGMTVLYLDTPQGRFAIPYRASKTFMQRLDTVCNLVAE